MTFERRDIHNSNVPEICRACEAWHKDVCGALTPPQLISFAKHTTRHTHESGAVLLREADPLGSRANIMKGVVKLLKILVDGRQQIVGLPSAPDFPSRLLASENSMTAEAALDGQICGFRKSALDRLVAVNPNLEDRLLYQTLRELDEAWEWLVTLGRKTTAKNVASFLHLIASHIDPETDGGASRFLLPLNRSDIADYLGLTIETFSRQMTRLCKAGWIEIENR
ncbi:MAG: Crp/Fnr family transcriptional regulator [Alphaproteobacteria bacterium]|nr:Crp/Fnr family transcriptional regulator [Alphaproteobacteria bacterium]